MQCTLISAASFSFSYQDGAPRGSPNKDEVFNRLATTRHAGDILQKYEQIKAEAELVGCTFRPQINSRSAHLVK